MGVLLDMVRDYLENPQLFRARLKTGSKVLKDITNPEFVEGVRKLAEMAKEFRQKR